MRQSQAATQFLCEVNAAIAAKLPQYLGQADNYKVTSNGSIFDLMRGKLNEVHVHGDNVQLSPLVRVHSFDADATDIHADIHTDAIKKIGAVTFQIQLVQADFDNYMAAADPADVAHGARITLQPTTITYSDNVGVWDVRTPFSVTGTLSLHPRNPAQLDFHASKASLAHLTIPEFIVDKVIDHDNPVVDLSQMKYRVAITSTTVQNGTLNVAGSIDLSNLLGTAPGDAK